MNSGRRRPDINEVGNALSSEEIDRIYGLEPVINVSDEMSTASEGTMHVVVSCPYCAESFETKIDMTGGSFEYVEDCQICCQPITLKVEISDSGELTGLNALQLNDCT